MKKLLIVLLALLTLVGCTNKGGYSQVSDKDTVIFKSDKITYTKADLYKSLKMDSVDAIMNDIILKIAEIQGIKEEDIDAKYLEEVEEMKASGIYDYYVQYMGSEEQMAIALKTSIKFQELKKMHIEEEFDALVKEDVPVKMQVSSFADKETADKCLKEINEGSTFDMASINNGYTTSSQEKVYFDSDDLPIEVKTYINDVSTTNGLVKEPIETVKKSTETDGTETETKTYYLVNIIEKDPVNFKQDYIDAKTEKFDTQELINILLSKYDIQFYDQDLYNAVTKEYEVLK